MKTYLPQHLHFADLSLFFKKLKQTFILENSAEEQNIAELTQANKELKFLVQSLQLSNQKALQENHNQTEFLASVAHELRNSIGAIISLSDFIKSEFYGKISNPEYVAIGGDIHAIADDIIEFTSDLIDTNQSSFGEFSIDTTREINLSEIVQRSVRISADYAAKRKIILKTEIAQDLKPINLDAKRLKQILTNLISNSVKYSRNGSEVKVIVKNKKDSLQIIVSDQGFGMTADQIQLSFQKYQTINNPNKGKVDSFGLGLPIVKQLVEKMHGVIEMKSEVNKGTETIITFPYHH